MPPDLWLAYNEAKASARPPIWHFSGLGLIAIAIVGVTISGKQQSEKVSRFILKPKAGDIYEMNIKEDVYTLYKIERIERDSVYFIANKFQSNEESGLSDLYVKPFDSSVTYGLPKNALIGLNRKNEIMDITRK